MTGVGYRQVDDAPFRQKLSGQERRRLLAEKFPSTQGLDWREVFDNDTDLLGHLLRDILKLDMAVPGQAGRRPSLDEKEATPSFDKMMGRDYCDRPYSLLGFAKTLRLLMGTRSLSTLETKVGIDRTRLFRLLRGTAVPSCTDMERVAEAFGKKPSFFFEFRVLTIANAIHNELTDDPEVTVRVYEKLWHSAG